MFKEGRIPRELYWAGFGFQVWMQMILQFMRAGPNAVLVIDEPDIYLHPDLQRRLLQLARTMFPQVFFATHSTEIINEAEPGDILSVDVENRSARRVTSDEDYRRVYAYLGSSENIEFSRLARRSVSVFFEGKDRKIIRKLSKLAALDELLDDRIRSTYKRAGLPSGDA